MTPTQRIKKELLFDALDWGSFDDEEITADYIAAIGAENIDYMYNALLVLQGLHWDLVEEFRVSGVPTYLPAPFSRYYEPESVARKLRNGAWVGWTYWHGGGNHGNPGLIPWMEEAYELDVVEEEKVVVVRTFTKRGRSDD